MLHGRLTPLVVVLASCVSACVPEQPTPEPPEAEKRPAPTLLACALDPACLWPLVVAHRGLGGGAPENTVAGVASAAAAGADVVEVDVRTAADGALVLMHDDTATRTTDQGTRFPDRPQVSGLTLAELKTLVVDAPGCSAETADAEPSRCRVATFDELLAAARGTVLVMIDLKDASPEAVAAAVRAADALDTAWFFDASEENLARAQAEEPSLVIMPRAQSADSARDLLGRLDPPLLHTDPGYQREAAADAKASGAKTLVNVLPSADLGFAAGTDSGFADAMAVLEQTLNDGVLLVQTNFAADVRPAVDAWMTTAATR